VVVLSFNIREVVSASTARAGHVKPKTIFKIGSDCSFAKSSAFRSENHGSFGYDLKNVAVGVAHLKEPSLLKTARAKHRPIRDTSKGDSRQIAEKLLVRLKTN
jgi:hypothetical protein